MKSTFSLLCLLLVGATHFASSNILGNPTFAALNWEESGPFCATGNGSFFQLYPFEFLLVDGVPTKLCFDTLHSRNFLQVTPFNLQWSFPNGSYFLNPNSSGFPLCYYEPNYTYDDFLVKYSSAREISTTLGRRNYLGLVKDPGTCNTTVAVQVVNAQPFFGRSKVIQYASQFYLSAVPGSCVPEKLAIVFNYEQWTFRTPDPALFQLPPTCLNNPLPYCPSFYPCDVVGIPPI